MPIRQDSTPSGGSKKKAAQKAAMIKSGYAQQEAPRIPYARSGIFGGSGFGLNKFAQIFGGAANAMMTPPIFFSPIQTPQNWQIAQKRREVYQWSRFWYENEPKVAAAIDFYAQFPMTGFKLKCRDRKVTKYFEKLCRELKLDYWLRYISHEYFLLGDVFPFLEIECPNCGGSGQDEEEEDGFCRHRKGKFRRMVCLNPDFIEVQQSPLADRPSIFMVPSEDLQKIVQMKQPRSVYDRLPHMIKQFIAQKKPIPLSPRCVSHIRHMASPYGVYGTSLLRRLFTTLAYKTKLVTANYTIAERLVLPIRVVKIGDKDRPAQAEDIADMQANLAAVTNDPNLTIVTHHAAEFEWIGATGRIHNITGEMEQIGKEILDGVMLNQALLNGEMGAYQAAQVGVETLLKRLEGWQKILSDWVYEHIFRPTAEMQGFIDHEATNELDDGETEYLYPDIEWEDMGIRDNSQEIQNLMQAHDKQLVSGQTLCEKLKLDYDLEVERIRHEQLNATAQGAQMGGPGGAPGGPGGGAGGPPGGPMGDPNAGGGAGGGPGAGGAMGDMSGTGGAAAPMGADGGAGMAPTAGGQAPLKIGKRGDKKPEQEEAPQQQFTQIKLTKLEQRMYKALQQLDIPYRGWMQYAMPVQGQAQPYTMDFAYPDVKVDIEADGAFHNDVESAQHDKERDTKLANLGWRVLRFKEGAIDDHIEDIKQIIYQNIYEAAQEKMKSHKKASVELNGLEVHCFNLTIGNKVIGKCYRMV